MTQKRAVRWAAGLTLAALVLVGVAWLAVPPIVKSQLESRGSALLGRELRVGTVSFEPWALAITLNGLTVAAAPGGAAGAPQFEVARLHVDADLRSLWRLAPVIEAIEIDAPRLRVARTGAGTYDFDDIVTRLKPAQPASPDAEPARFALFNVRISDGEIDFDDRPVQRRHTLRALQLALPFLSNLPDHVDVKVEPRLALQLDGTAFDLHGRSVPFAQDRATELELKFADFKLGPLWAYAPGSFPLRPEGGVLGADLALKFAQPAGQTPRLAVSGTLTLRDIAVRNLQAQPMLAWKSFAVQLSDVRPLERVVALGTMRLEGFEADVRRDAAGGLEWAALGGARAAPAASPASASASAPGGAPVPAMPWRFSAGRTELVSARVRWHDAHVSPAAAFALDTLDASAERLRWPTEGDVPVQLTARVTAGAQEVAQLKLQGETSDKHAALTLKADGLTLGAAAPYFAPLLHPALEGRASLTAALDWAAGDSPRLALTVPTLQVDDLRLTEREAVRTARKPVPAIAVKTLTVADTSVDLLARQVSVGALHVRQPVINLRRAPDGALNVTQWLVAAPAATSAPAAAQAGAPPNTSTTMPWRARLAELLVEGGQASLIDAAVRPGSPVTLQLRALRVALHGLAWPAVATPARLQVAAQFPGVAAAGPAPIGRMDVQGQLVLAPPAIKANVTLERLPVHVFEPYFGPMLPVRLERAELGWRGQVDVKQGPQGLTLNTRGDVLLADLQVNARAAEGSTQRGDELLTWNSLTLKPLSVAIAAGTKPRIEIGEVQLNDFFSRLIITEDGRFNLRDVAAQPPAGSASAPAAAVAAAPAPAASAVPADLPIDLVIGGTKLVNGRVDFTDRFVRPSYSAALSELNGSIGRLASGTRDMATVDLKGRVAGTGLLEIRGAFNPTAKPLALDISARTTDIELAPFSTYAGKYAGYGIERGKLSLDVAYRIEADGKLEAKNQLTLNQLTFGEATNSPDATKLPVRLAISLLTDRNGVIDIDLPVSGSVNDPQFSVFGIVLKIIGNLLVKAVTAPFALLAGGGAGADLSLVEFVPGTARMAPASSANIDRVAKALTDRPALRMTVTGAADPVSEREAMQSADLEARVQAEQQRDRARAGGSAAAAASAPEAALPSLGAEDRARYIKRLYADTKLPDKPRNLLGMAKDIPVPEMEAMLRNATLVSTDTARQLALQRGLAVRDVLIARGLPSERLFLGAPKLRASGEEDAAWTPRVQLSLSAP